MMDDKEMTTCPHCGEVVKKGNFCNKCGKKLSKICDCWLMKRQYHCKFQTILLANALKVPVEDIEELPVAEFVQALSKVNAFLFAQDLVKDSK